jgi:phage recombination protein Bet
MNAIVSYDEKKNQERLELLRRHFGKELQFEELELFGLICERTQLDPFIKQIYPVKRKQKQADGSQREVMVIQVSIDGLRSIAERTGCYSPGREPTYVYDGKTIVSATSYIKKMTTDGTWHDVSATAFMSEYRPKYGHFWDNMPHLMLAKCAEALAIRKAFPAQTAKVYTPEEMEQAETTSNVGQSQIIDCEPNEVASTWFDELRKHLAADGIPTDRLAEWINLRAQMKNESPAKIVDLCLETNTLPKFKKAFSKFLEPDVLCV